MSEAAEKLTLSFDQLNLDRSRMFLNFPASYKERAKPSPPNLPNSHEHCSHNIVHLLQKSRTGTLNVKEKVHKFSAEDLVDLGEIGRGNFGTVNKMFHKESRMEMAVKRIRATVDESEQKHMLKELDVVMNSSNCPYIVNFYGAIFEEGDCWICMELMATSLDKTYKAVHRKLHQRIPEGILGRIAYCVIKALDYLKTNLNIIHRDVKPSNILLDGEGQTKLCDFGISGQLVDSIAKTRDAGCQPYMAPERIDPFHARCGYDVRSDVWSLGLSLIEVATGKFPYPIWKTVFDQLSQVVRGDAPQLTNSPEQTFSPECLDFVNTCMIKDFNQRPKYRELLDHPFIKRYSQHNNVNTWFRDVVLKVPDISPSTEFETTGTIV